MKKTNKSIVIVIILAILIVGGAVGIIIINCDNNGFYQISLYQLISLIFQFISLCLVVFVSYYLVQMQTDIRKKRDVLGDMINGIIDSSYELNKEALSTENSKLFMVKLRNIENDISLMDNVAKEFNIESDINYIKNEVVRIDDLVSEHIGNNDELMILYVDIEKNINNIQNKCNSIKFNIYFN